MEQCDILLEYIGSTALVTIARPARKNAFNQALFTRLAEITGELAKKPPRAIVLTGAGESAFSAGFDVRPDNPMVERMVNAVSEGDRGPARALIDTIRGAVDAFVSLPVPVIAAVNGLAYGGGAELAVRCDLRVFDPAAVICFSEVRLGLMPDWGGGAALARLIGPSRAADLVLTARETDAAEALSLGIANRVSGAGRAREEALEMAAMIAANGPKAVRSALSLLRHAGGAAYAASLAEEAGLAVELLATGECVHGIVAFIEKKKPEFPDIE